MNFCDRCGACAEAAELEKNAERHDQELCDYCAHENDEANRQQVAA